MKPIEQVVTEQSIPNNYGKLSMAKNVTTCRAQFPLNKNGEVAGALERIEGYRECDSTSWFWSTIEQKRCCTVCFTPQS